MVLDLRTLLIAVTLAAAICTAARFVLWALHPAFPGLARWAWGGLAGTLALGLISVRGLIPAFFTQSCALAFQVSAGILVWDGFRRFAGGEPVRGRILAALAVLTVIPLLASLLAHDFTIQLICNTALMACISTLAARELLRRRGPGRRAMRATGWLMGAVALLFLVRTVAVAQGTSPAGTLGYATLLWWMGTTIALTLGMVLMAGERLQQDLDQQASRDPLTGALNRRAFDLLAYREQARALRSGQPLAVIMMDLDHFKRINDQLGHAGGDSVLRLFVEIVSRTLRAQDLFCRFGGEEFVALLPGASLRQALEVAERVRLNYAEAARTAFEGALGSDLALTVSLGISELRDGETMDDAVRRADTALYQAKAAGRNRSALPAPAIATSSVNPSTRSA